MELRETKIEEVSDELKRERLERELYPIRDVNGEPNYKDMEIVLEIDRELLQYPAFIALAPFGSVMNGIKVQSSDIDVRVLYDPKKFNNPSEYTEFLKSCENVCKNKEDKNNQKIHLFTQPINIENIKSRVVSHFQTRDFPKRELAEMSRIATGERIKSYIDDISKVLQILSKNDQEKDVDGIVECLMKIESWGIEKQRERMPSLNIEEYNEMFEKRRELWRQRVKEVWGIGEK